MNKELENNDLTETTRANLKDLSKAMLRLHKTLLDAAKADYEDQHGKISSPNQYLQLVIDDPHFAWLRKISSMVALLDEATSIRRAANETEAVTLLSEAGKLLNFEDSDEDFNNKLQNALQKNPDAVIGFNDTKSYLNK